MYKYETHMHTAETSACASASGKEQADRYKELGYDGIIITDHFLNGNCHEAIKKTADWAEKIDLFMAGYEAAKEEGDKIGLKVFFGFEYCYEGADILTYGLDRQWLLTHPEIEWLDFFSFSRLAHSSGAALIHAHPFREAGYLREIRLVPQWIDGVEVFNCGNADDAYNDRADRFADWYGFVKTGGTDNHHLWVNRFSGIYMERPLESINDYINAIKQKTIGGVIYPDDYIRKDGILYYET